MYLGARPGARRVAGERGSRPGDMFRGWLWVITRNKLGDWMRSQGDRETAAGGRRRGSLLPFEHEQVQLIALLGAELLGRRAAHRRVAQFHLVSLHRDDTLGLGPLALRPVGDLQRDPAGS